jgi:hypothetical protein
MILAYVCRQYTGDVEQNILDALDVAREINAIPGWIAVVPHQLGRDIAETKTYDEWMRLCLAIADTCHVLVVDGAYSVSRGCLIERTENCNTPQIERRTISAIAAVATKGLLPDLPADGLHSFLDSFVPGLAQMAEMRKALEKLGGDK